MALSGPFAARGGRWPDMAAVGSLVLLPLLVKAPLLFGSLVADPLVGYAGVTSGPTEKLFWGEPTIDPNIAFTSHALGTLGARMAAGEGSIWWNPYEGVGAPLAGEMQSAALFPPTWLLVLPNGQLLEHLLFQIVAGIATFLLLRRLGAGRVGAWVAGVAFGFNGVFAWMANAVINPIAFLPVILLGVEYLRDRTTAGRGGALIAGGVAASLYAGFPEVAYLNGLLITAWTLVRAFEAGRAGGITLIKRASGFALCGVLIAAPVLIAFADFLRVAHLGVHAGGAAADLQLQPWYAITVLLPYYAGHIFAIRSHADFWSSVGGYAGLTVAMLAAVGAQGGRDRPLRIMLATWILVCLAVTFGFRPLTMIVKLIPFTSPIALCRYLNSSWSLALAVLAGLAVDDFSSKRIEARSLRIAVAVVLAAGFAFAGWGWLRGVVPADAKALLIVLLQLTIFGLAAAAMLRRAPTPTRRGVVLAAAVMSEAVLLFALPVMRYPRSAKVDLASVRFLQARLGLQRFVTLGPISANYGSYFGIGQVNHNDLPVPQRWVDYARRHLDPNADPIVFGPSSPAAFAERISAYAAIGTKYVVTHADRPIQGLQEVHADPVARVYRLPGARSYFAASGCSIVERGRLQVELNCARPATLERLELFMEGWSATVSGQAAQVLPAGELFQAVRVPAGRSTVEFSFRPPYMPVGYVLAALGLLGLLVGWRSVGRTSPVTGS